MTLVFSRHKTYNFLFFSVAYAFITFWTAAVFSTGSLMGWGGVALYVLVAFFHRAIILIHQKNEDGFEDQHRRFKLFFVPVALWFFIFIICIHFARRHIVQAGLVSGDWFVWVGWTFFFLSLLISFLISFTSRQHR